MSARAIHIGKWAVKTISQFGNFCKNRYRKRKQHELLEELRLNELFIQRMVIQSMVHDHIEMGCMNIINSLLLYEKQNQQKSFFITQKQILNEKEYPLEQDCSLHHLVMERRSACNENLIEPPDKDLLISNQESPSSFQSYPSDVNSNKSNMSSPSKLQYLRNHTTIATTNSEQRLNVNRPIRRESKVIIAFSIIFQRVNIF